MDETFSQKFCSLRTLKFRICYELKKKKKIKRFQRRNLPLEHSSVQTNKRKLVLASGFRLRNSWLLSLFIQGSTTAQFALHWSFLSPPRLWCCWTGGLHTPTAHTSLIVSKGFLHERITGKCLHLEAASSPWMFWSRFAFLFQLWKFDGLILQSFGDCWFLVRALGAVSIPWKLGDI